MTRPRTTRVISADTQAATPAGGKAATSTLTEALARRLRQAILDGVYVPGQRLVESDLMADFSAGRGPLRDAFRILAADGIIQITPNRGAAVRKLSLKELLDVFRMREALEGLAARLAAERMGDAALRARFAKALAAIPIGSPESPDGFGKANSRFHQLIITYADNEQLQVTLEQLRLPLVRLQVRAAIDVGFRERSTREHDRLARALLAGDADAAESAMRAHLKGARKRILALAEGEPHLRQGT